jgi:S-formylglutathione hydrolase FrmB
MNRAFRATVLLPDSYTSGDRHYSVIYCLHGYGGNFRTWPEVVALSVLSDSLQVIFICPDGNVASWYLDSPVKKNSKFDTYISSEVVSFVDKRYRTFPLDSGRAIVGASMGGHGALTLLARHPGVYRAAASVSGVMDLAEFPTRWEIAKVLGPYNANVQRWIDASAVAMIPLFTGRNQGVALDCGTEDFALPGNRKAHALLLSNNIPHQYHEGPGGHTATYVGANAGRDIAYLVQFLKKPQ